MNAAIKTRLDAIDEQMAALQKEQAKLREELDAPGFVPGWYLSWDKDEPTRSGITALLKIAEKVQKAGASLLETGSGQVIGNDMQGELYLGMLGLAAKVERDMISERIKSALRVRKEKGMILGRPAGKSKLDERKVEIEGYQKMELSKAKIAKLLGCSRTTYLAWLEKETEKAGK